jgi:hypothetical protein
VCFYWLSSHTVQTEDTAHCTRRYRWDHCFRFLHFFICHRTITFPFSLTDPLLLINTIIALFAESCLWWKGFACLSVCQHVMLMGCVSTQGERGREECLNTTGQQAEALKAAWPSSDVESWGSRASTDLRLITSAINCESHACTTVYAGLDLCPKWHPIPYFWLGPIRLWWKVVYCIGNRVPFGRQPWLATAKRLS